MPLMTAIDKNSDGELSADEIESAPKSLMTLDKDKNGKISSEELRPAFGPGGPGGFGGGPDMSADLVQRMLAFDKNGDGKLSAGELPERMKTLMERADTNKDGFLDRTELTAQARRPGPGNPEGRRGIGPESKDRDREGGDRGESKERSRPSTTSE